MVSRKLASQPPLNAHAAMAAASSKSSTISVRDKLTNNLFLIDSGDKGSLIVPTAANKVKGSNKKPLTTVKIEHLQLKNNEHPTHWSYI